ncbi:outer membrane lipoprotein-sorting protein [bacterium]|nr:outer membrane lipoprotein-sorting protein [bacterium]
MKLKQPSILFLGLFFICCFPQLGISADLNAQQIVARGEDQMRGLSSQATMEMVISRPTYERTLSLRSWATGTERALVEILKPAKEEGVASLRVDANMWNYLPKTDQVVRVPSSLMLQSWMGSDFTNDDLMKASSLSRDYKHNIIRKGTKNQEAAVLIECKPKPSAPVVWGKVMHWARLSDFLPVHQEFFDEKGKLVRTITFSDFKTMDDRIIPTRLHIQQAGNPKEATTVTYEKIVFNKEIPMSVFSKEEIRRMSQKGKVITAGWFLDPRKVRN